MSDVNVSITRVGPLASVNSSIAVSGISPATLGSNSIVSVGLNLTHTYDGDLTLSLVSPSGSSIFKTSVY